MYIKRNDHNINYSYFSFSWQWNSNQGQDRISQSLSQLLSYLD